MTMKATTAPAIRIRDLHTWYGESHILHGINMDVMQGEVVSLLGRNGAGRTTTLRAIVGLTGRREGSIQVAGTETISMVPHKIARFGIGYCPEERGIMSSLTCEENLMLPPKISEGGMNIEEIYEIFPNLKMRRNSPGGRLSGGEQQMLAMGRILRSGAKTLLLDEISEGLAPVIVQTLARTIELLRERGLTVLMVEQNFRFAALLSDRFYIMERGLIVREFSAAQLTHNMEVLHECLGV